MCRIHVLGEPRRKGTCVVKLTCVDKQVNVRKKMDLCDQETETLFTYKYVWVGLRKVERKRRIEIEWCLAVMCSGSAVRLKAHSGVDRQMSDYGGSILMMAADGC